MTWRLVFNTLALSSTAMFATLPMSGTIRTAHDVYCSAHRRLAACVLCVDQRTVLGSGQDLVIQNAYVLVGNGADLSLCYGVSIT